MATHVTDEEQLQLLKDWWEKYGLAVVGGIILSIVFTYGYRYYDNTQTEKLGQASMVFEQLLAGVVDEDAKAVTENSQTLKETYPKTTYATFASFFMAKQAVQAKDYAAAMAEFDWVITHSKHELLTQIARLRKARIEFAAGKADNALLTLQEVTSPSFTAFAEEIKGDIYKSKGQLEKARLAYAAAANDAQNVQGLSFVQMKLDDIGAAPTVARQSQIDALSVDTL